MKKLFKLKNFLSLNVMPNNKSKVEKPIVIVTEQGASKVTNDLKPRGKDKAVKCIMKIMENHEGPINVIDMHNVLDLFVDNAEIPFQRLNGIRICVSWVGNPDGEIGRALVPDMQERIKSGQITFGIICSKRGKRPKKNKRSSDDPDALSRNYCVEPGSKAYIINKLAEWSKNEKEEVYFFDDAKDHVNSVASLHIGVHTYLVPRGDGGIKFLEDLCNELHKN